MTALNPYLRIGDQLAEVLVVHQGSTMAAARAEATRMLEAVRIAGARERLRCYPYQFSGGMRQRVLIAMALLSRPRLLIADEPTTALDVTVQSQILKLLAELQRELKMALLLITHDLGIVESICERVLVMYAGRCMEQGQVAEVLANPRHPYTRALMNARPRLQQTQRLQPIAGQPPGPSTSLPGCVFAPRCSQAIPGCESARPEWRGEPNEGCACILVAVD
jgi:oligopeptide transport system ATP-binding protein